MSPNPTPGLYIDRLHPASCSGQITQWNFCYFNPQNFHDRDRVQIHLQVWRFNSPQRGVQVADHVVTINIPEEPEEFQCETITLDQDSYMNITEGDYLGVQLLFNRVLPVVGNSQEQTNTVFRPFNSFLPTIVDVRAPGTIILSSNVLHVNAIVGKKHVIIINIELSTSLKEDIFFNISLKVNGYCNNVRTSCICINTV